MTTAGAPVSVGHFFVIQTTQEVADQLKAAIENDEMVDFSEVDEDEFKVVAEFDGIGQGVIV